MGRTLLIASYITVLGLLQGCAGKSQIQPEGHTLPRVVTPHHRNRLTVIHTVVALCDNAHQGIVPVPAKIGNGEDLTNNLYWGCDCGVLSYFKRLPDWKLVSSTKNPKVNVLERAVFLDRRANTVLVADAYRGATIKDATEQFLRYAGGADEDPVQVLGKPVYGGGAANLVAYIGHDGLMDFSLDPAQFQSPSGRKVAVLCCKSSQFFAPFLQSAHADLLLGTKSLMCPEAYSLEAAIKSLRAGEKGKPVIDRAAKAYARYQHISIRAARTVFSAAS